VGLETAIAPALGHHPTVEREECLSIAAVTLGDLVALDAATAGSVSGGNVYKVRQPVTGDLIAGEFGVALEDVAAGKYGKFARRGRVKMLMAAATALGANLSATNASDAATASATTQKVIAKCRVLTSAAGLTDVDFDGIYGNLA